MLKEEYRLLNKQLTASENNIQQAQLDLEKIENKKFVSEDVKMDIESDNKNINHGGVPVEGSVTTYNVRNSYKRVGFI